MLPWRWQPLEVWCFRKELSLFRATLFPSIHHVLSLSTLAILSEGLIVCALAVDLRLKRRLDKYMAWGIAIVAGAKVHDKQSQADNKSSNIYHQTSTSTDVDYIGA